MKAPVSLGFLTPKPGDIRGADWHLTAVGHPVTDDPTRLPEWDYFKDVKVHRTLEVDLPKVLADCRLPADARLEATISWHSSWTNLRGALPGIPISSRATELELKLPGEQLGGRLTLDTHVLLRRPGASQHPLAPARPGTTLWTESTIVDLGSDAQRFPVVAVDFAHAGIADGRGGAWALSIEETDLAASATGAVRLYLNSAHPRIRQILDAVEPSADVELREIIFYDAARTLLTFAASHDDLDDEAEHDAGTLGDLLVGLVRVCFQDRGVAGMRGLLRESPGEFATELQASLRLLERPA
ncbi:MULTISPECIES: hypothetical protein [Pseudofrankia]|uniref:hypothetical protein n=1 Tax=Pseudofrankia TaxID=2994363 RepID=UPI000234C16E|nr:MULTISPECIES: hypothetical protein [Pseudofrankia]OHV42029.1 hypothetical protein BCD49_00235 [Pseudofrankia sp. EUN1h]